jgi:hypothetical protein
MNCPTHEVANMEITFKLAFKESWIFFKTSVLLQDMYGTSVALISNVTIFAVLVFMNVSIPMLDIWMAYSCHDFL